MTPPANGFYQVSEVVDDTPRTQKSKIITEQIFEAKNTAKKEPRPETPSEVPESVTQEKDTAPTTQPETTQVTESSPLTTSTTQSPSSSPKSRQTPQETKRKLPRDQLRSRVNTRVEETTTTARTSTRTRPTRRSQETKPTTPQAETIRTRGSRRRPIEQTTFPSRTEAPRGRGHHLAVENEHENPSRLRTGRRTEIPPRSNRRIDSSEDVLEIRDIPRSRKLHTASSRRTETKVLAAPETSTQFPSRGRGRSAVRKVEEPTTSRRTSRVRSLPVFDETKLEVLPLFESEARTEKSTAVDNIPNSFTSRTVLESTSPLTTSTRAESTTTALPNVKSNRRFPSRTKEVKNNNIEEPKPRSSRRFSTTSITTIAPRSDNRRQRERSQSRPRNSETTTEVSRRRSERVKPKRVEPTLSDNRLQTLTPRRSNRRVLTVSTTEVPTTTKGRTRFEKDDFNIEEVAESSMTKSIEKLSDDSPLKHSKNSKRGTTKEHSEEETIEETDNYPEAFKALLQAKSKLKVSASDEIVHM